MSNLGQRIVVLIDMDCFFCQVETKLQPEYANKPLAVVQYSQWSTGGGGIIAVNYEAREFGVTRHMRGDEAKVKCPEIILATVPPLRGKADTSRYRIAGREVVEVLKKHCNIIERASVDEAYLDITQLVDEKVVGNYIDESTLINRLENTFIVGHSESKSNDEVARREGLKKWLANLHDDDQVQRFAVAATIVENIRRDIFETTGYRCSAGISFNKILAKLACGIHKPNRQTVLPASAVPELFTTLPVKKVRNLGGKLGDVVVESLNCNVMSDILQYPLQYLQDRFDDKTGLWLFNIARGIDNELVTPRLVSKSIGVCKKFPGKQAIKHNEVLKRWLGDLSAEVCERLEQDMEENERRATLLTVSYQIKTENNVLSQSKSSNLLSHKQEKILEQCFNIITKAAQQNPITYIGISVGKFVQAKGSENFVNFFKTFETDNQTIKNSAINNFDVALKNKRDIQYDAEKVENLEHSSSLTKSDDHSCHKREVKNSIEELQKKSSPVSPCSALRRNLKPDNFSKSFFMKMFKTKPEVDINNVHNNKSPPVESDAEETNIDEKDLVNDKANLNEDTQDVIKENYTKAIQEENAATDLQEIFPDLDDIDINIVRLLPYNLQLEAKKILKQKEEKLLKNSSVNSKIKGRSMKSKTVNDQASKKGIENFFIKANTKDDGESNFKKCKECGQLIVFDKYNEHQDFHVAQNLQKEMNKEQYQDTQESRKRKDDFGFGNNAKKRLSNEQETS